MPKITDAASLRFLNGPQTAMFNDPYKGRTADREDKSLANSERGTSISAGNLALAQQREAREATEQTTGGLPTGYRWADAAHTKQEIIPGGPADTGGDSPTGGMAEQAMVKALVDGRMQFPAGAALRSPYWQNMLAKVAQVDPTFDAVNYNARAATRRDFTSGKAAQNITAFNTALGHLGTLSEAAQQLNNGNVRPFNTIINTAESTFGDPRVDKFNAAKHAAVDELEKAFRGSSGTQAGINEWEQTLNSSKSPEQFHQVIGQMVDLLGSRINALGEQYKSGMGRSIDGITLLDPHAQAVFHALGPGGSGTIGKPPPDNNPLMGGSGGSGGPPAGGQGGGSLAAGPTRIESDTQGSKIIDSMIRAGASDDQIDAALTAIGSNKIDRSGAAAARAYLAKNPGYKGSFGGATKAVANPFISQAAASPVGAYAINAADALTAGNLDSLTADPAAARAGMEAVQSAHPVASLLGGVTGSGLAAAGVEAGLGGLAARAGGSVATALANPLTADAAYGAAYGAGSDDDNRVAGALLGGGLGALGGVAGRKVAGAASTALAGVASPAADYLRAQGVPLTVGQLLSQTGTVGRTVKGVEDRLTGLPVVGNIINARRREGLEAFNRAAFDQGLAPIGATTDGVTAEAGIDAARGLRSQAYQNALDPVTLSPDGQFLGDVAGAEMSAANLPADMATRGAYALNRAGENVDANAELSGDGLQQAMRRFRRTASENASLPNGHDLGDVMRQGEDAYTGLVARQSPETLPALAAANAANRNVSVLKDAVNAAKGNEGVFMPSQLMNAAASNARRFGDTAGTTAQPFFELTRAAQPVLPSKVADSGTAGRLATQALLAGGGAGTVGYAAGGQEGAEGATGTGLGVAALLALGGTRTGQAAITRALVDRPQSFVNLAGKVAAHDDIARLLGTGVGADLVPYWSQ